MPLIIKQQTLSQIKFTFFILIKFSPKKQQTRKWAHWSVMDQWDRNLDLVAVSVLQLDMEPCVVPILAQFWT